MGKNYDKLMQKLGNEHKPFIVYTVESTGRMRGHNDRITQIALVSYKWNDSAKRYELQDNLFILAKADIGQLDTTAAMRMPTKENAIRELQESYKYNYGRADIKAYETCLGHIAKYEKDIADVAAGTYKGRFRPDTLHKNLSKYQAQAVELKKKVDDIMAYKQQHGDKIVETPECKQYVADNLDDYIEKMRKEPSLPDELALQGISFAEYRKGKIGLEPAEMQTGINEFLKKYDSPDTVFVTNGTYYEQRYLQKENMSIDKPAENIIDFAAITQEDSTKAADVRLEDFVAFYKRATTKTIKTFDAFTKALCYAEIAAKNCKLNLSNRSLEQLTNAVKEAAFKNDHNYVMSISSMANMNWTKIDRKIFADYTFNSLEYVEFGNDRRYVDIDKMFEVNDNFEITLEGDKTPIKTWEELEAKIKALNSHISDQLLEKIKTKYEELEHRVEASRPAPKQPVVKPVEAPRPTAPPVVQPRPVVPVPPKPVQQVQPKMPDARNTGGTNPHQPENRPDPMPDQPTTATIIKNDTQARVQANENAVADSLEARLNKLTQLQTQNDSKFDQTVKAVMAQFGNVSQFLAPTFNAALVLQERYGKDLTKIIPTDFYGLVISRETDKPIFEFYTEDHIVMSLLNQGPHYFDSLFDENKVRGFKADLDGKLSKFLDEAIASEITRQQNIPDKYLPFIFEDKKPEFKQPEVPQQTPKGPSMPPQAPKGPSWIIGGNRDL